MSPAITRKPVSADDAYNRAAARCATAEYCQADWRRKLGTMGLGRDATERVIGRLVDEGFIDDARYARAYVHDKAAYDRWGPLKIRQGLMAKGVAAAIVDEALAAADTAQWRDNLLALLRQKARTVTAADGYGRRQKLVRFAAGRGYEAEAIFRLLDELSDEFPEEEAT